MTYALERKRIGKKPFTYIELRLDYCTLNIGESPCTGNIIASGTATAGGTATITLAVGSSAVDDFYLNHAVRTKAGTGPNQTGRIIGYVGATRVATVAVDWATQPDATTTYDLIDRRTACHNTRSTCKDTPNYTPSNTENNVWLTTDSVDFPRGLAPAGVGAIIPCLKTIQAAPTRITLGKGIGYRASISCTFKDLTHHDRGLDKYVDYREYIPAEQGTFWGKYLARNRFYQKRELSFFQGYIAPTGYDANDFRELAFIIEKMEGPTSGDTAKVTAKDFLKFVDDKRAVVPALSAGSLASGISAGAGSFSANSGEGAGYAAAGFARIDSEYFGYTRVGDVFTVTENGAWGTTQATHAAGASIQECWYAQSVNVVDIIYEFMNTYAGISATYLPYNDNPSVPDEWDDEKANFLGSYDLTTIIGKPTGIATLLAELAEQCLIMFWWDPENKLVKLVTNAPGRSGTTLNDDEHFLKDSISVKEDPKQRVSQIWVYYNSLDYTKSSLDNYQSWYIKTDADLEGSDQYNEAAIREIKSRWFTDANLGVIIEMAGRMITLFGLNPRIVTFRMDIKDGDTVTGDIVQMDTDQQQDASGANLHMNGIVLEHREVELGHTIEYVAQEYPFVGRYGTIGPDTLGEYTAESDANKAAYAFICLDTGLFADGTEGYKIA